MTHVHDLYEPGDDRGPGAPEQEPPLDLDAAESTYREACCEWHSGVQGDALHALASAIAELREARQRIAEWEALEKREEWAVTLGGAAPPTGPIEDGDLSKAALDLARKHKGQAWRRTLTVHPWEPIADKAPF